MTDIYPTPGTELSQPVARSRAGGNVEDAPGDDCEVDLLERWTRTGGRSGLRAG